MKLFGYRKGCEDNAPVELAELSFAGDTTHLRAVAQFLIRSADLLDQNEDRFGHEHLSDTDSGWPTEFPDVIVARQQT